MSYDLNENKELENAIQKACEEQSEDSVIGVMRALQKSMENGGMLLVAMGEREEASCFEMRKLKTTGGGETLAVFTSLSEAGKGKTVPMMFQFTKALFADAQQLQWCVGILFNPWGESFFLPKELIPLIPGV